MARIPGSRMAQKSMDGVRVQAGAMRCGDPASPGRIQSARLEETPASRSGSSAGKYCRLFTSRLDLISVVVNAGEVGGRAAGMFQGADGTRGLPTSQP